MVKEEAWGLAFGVSDSGELGCTGQCAGRARLRAALPMPCCSPTSGRSGGWPGSAQWQQNQARMSRLAQPGPPAPTLSPQLWRVENKTLAKIYTEDHGLLVLG